MTVLIGIDEAGYGPILGPLVVSAVAFEVPEGLLRSSLWEMLPRSVTRGLAGAAGRIAINDSKKLHHGRGGYHTLQRGVLACLSACTGQPPPVTLGRLLRLLDAQCTDQLAEYPWYGLTAPDFPLRFDARDVTTAATALAGELKQQGTPLLGLWTRPLFAGRFNQMVEAVGNKASVALSLLSQLIDGAYRRFGREDLQILIDKQGGRTHYRKNLQRLFPHLRLKIIQESPDTSSYHLSETAVPASDPPGDGPGRQMKVHFLAKGEQRQLPIALASMTSKYVRELFMEILNAYFARLCPGIKPTAGYYQDGKRFLADLRQFHLEPQRRPAELLIRRR